MLSLDLSKDRTWRERLRAAAAQDMRTRKQCGNDALLAKLRKALPHAVLPEIAYVPPDAEALYWPLGDAAALAIYDAMREAGLDMTPHCDPNVCIRQVIEARAAAMRAQEMTT